uniref:Secreted protein n=1 Tax=Knipowitschia caucasica TaxID=637954 RepID=A0AAV2K382_KNICA
MISPSVVASLVSIHSLASALDVGDTNTGQQCDLDVCVSSASHLSELSVEPAAVTPRSKLASLLFLNEIRVGGPSPRSTAVAPIIAYLNFRQEVGPLVATQHE